jgi:hypothetical protein
MLGAVLRANFVANGSHKYFELFCNIFHAVCFIAIYFGIRMLVIYSASVSLIKASQKKENYSKKEMFSFILTDKFSVFSAILYLTEYSRKPKTQMVQ